MVAINKLNGDTIYQSGTLDGNGDLRNHHSEYVKKGLLAKDNDLTIFNGIAKKHGKEIGFFGRQMQSKIEPFRHLSREAVFILFLL